MSVTTTHGNAMLLLEFNATNYTGVATATAHSDYLALTTTDPGVGGTMTGELTYTGYARVEVAATNTNWTVSGLTVTNALLIAFGKRTDAGADQTAAYVVLISAASGGTAKHVCALGTPIVISQNDVPRFIAGAIDFTLA